MLARGRLKGGERSGMQGREGQWRRMPLESYEAGPQDIDRETLAHVRFGKVLDGKVIPCCVSIDGPRNFFHEAIPAAHERHGRTLQRLNLSPGVRASRSQLDQEAMLRGSPRP